MRCEWCGKEHNSTADMQRVLIVGGVDSFVCVGCIDDAQAEAEDEAEYQAALQATRDDDFHFSNM